ncbi:MAG: right-handed parallel beta-helix repeat-containing protein [Gemmatimonadaceae bacterium]|nr:right-handed parallel beta-helix repeat-containing protein [Gemmatimonadaceae bacterium]
MNALRHVLRTALLSLGILSVPRSAAATNYYVNSRAGNDTNSGTSREAAWKGLANLETRTFVPGDSILFARGSSYTGGFTFRSSGTAEHPIVFATYSLSADVVRRVERSQLEPYLILHGAGRAPSFTNPDWTVLNANIFHVTGHHVVIDGFYFHDTANPPSSDHVNRNVQKLGAVYLALGSSNVTVRNCEFLNTPVGIKIKGEHHLITHNDLHDAYEPMARSWGPIAIMVVSPHNEISHNRITNYGSYGGPYGSDGGAIELDGVDEAFDGRDISIHHNVSINNHGFLELAGRRVDGVSVAWNLSDDRNQFIGGGSMRNVVVVNNTVVRTREPSIDRFIFWTFAKDSTFITVRNNIFVIAPDLMVFGPDRPQLPRKRAAIGAQLRDHNLFHSPGNPDPIGVPRAAGDIVADPLFLDSEHGNFRLSERSPARGRGAVLGAGTDLDGRPVLARKARDLGAFQF